VSAGACSRCARPGVQLRYTGPTGRICGRCSRQLRTFCCPGCGGERETHSATRDEHRRAVQCWDCRQAETAAGHTRAIVDHVARLEPGLALPVITTVVDETAPSRVERKRLAEHLAAHPDALVSAAATATRVVCRLAAGLVAAGAVRVRPPRCGRCGEVRLLVADTDEHGRICNTCDGHLRAEPCSRCGRKRVVSIRTPDGRPVCNPCRRKDPATWAICSRCGQFRRVNARAVDGDAICPGCYEPPRDRCTGCDEIAIITARADGAAWCYRCYEHPRRRCGGCGRTRRIYRRARDGEPDLCHACHWAPTALCVGCGAEAPGFGATTDGHRCLRCLAAERLDLVLTAPDGTIPDALAGLRDAFFAAQQPRSVFTWLAQSPAVHIVRQLATGELDLTHDALDRLPQTASLRHLRQLLVATGALPEREPSLAALEQFIAATVEEINHPADARLLLGFGTWRVLGRLRRRTKLAYHSAGNARDLFVQAAQFLGWLHDHGLELAACRQHHLDAWLAAGPAHRRRVRYFLVWAAERDAISGIEPPVDRHRSLPPPTDTEAGWDHARCLLHDDDINPADRVVGTLVVLYAQPLTRVARLRLDDVVEVDGDIHLNLGKDLVFMPEPLAGFLRQLPWRRQIGPSGHVPGAEQWLFPGRQAGRHQHPDHLAARLRTLDIPNRASRHAALVRLGAQLPAKVLADLLNIHINTAVRWTKTAGGDWTNYAADRIRRPHLSSPR
jgi:hypothetical protein